MDYLDFLSDNDSPRTIDDVLAESELPPFVDDNLAVDNKKSAMLESVPKHNKDDSPPPALFNGTYNSTGTAANCQERYDTMKNDSQDSWLADYQARFKPTVTDADISAIQALPKDEKNKFKEQLLKTDWTATPLFEPAKIGGICPICGNGSGRDGTGIKAGKYSDHYRYKCFAQNCFTFNGKENCNWLEFIAVMNDIPNLKGKNFYRVLAICKKIQDKTFNGHFDAVAVTDSFKARQDNNSNTVPVERISNDLKFARKEFHDTDQWQNYDGYTTSKLISGELITNRIRGLTIDTLNKFGVGFLKFWRHPKEGEKYFCKPCWIIATSDSHYTAIAVKYPNHFRADSKAYGAKIKHAGNMELFGNIKHKDLDTLIKHRDFVFITEGEFDVMSIAQVTNFEYGVIGGGGTSNKNLILQFLNSTLPADQRHNFTPIYIADNDSAGINAADETVNLLKQNGYPAVYYLLDDSATSKVDANDFLIKYGDKALSARIEEIIGDAQKQLPSIQEELFKTPKNNDTPAENSANLSDNSDVANAQRLFEYCRDKIRYLYDVDKWAFFDGQKWTIAPNATNAPLYKYALALGKSTNNKKVAKIFSTTKKINAAITLIKGIGDAIITRDDLNNHPHLLNCKNGVIDLQTKKLYPADPSLLLTQMINAEYRAGYHDEVVNKFLRDIMPDDDTRAALLRFLGYCLTGEVLEEKAMIFNGGGGNGKGTLTGTLLNLFGNYGTPFPVGAILANKFSGDEDANAPTPAYNKLLFTRIAISEEVPQGRKISASKFKLLTGGDRIPIRRLHEEATEIEHPAHKLIISGNYLPELQDAADAGIIRRLMNIQFTKKFDDKTRDIHLKTKLVTTDALSGLLSLLVDNAAQWYQSGLLESAEMTAAKKNYINEQDFISAFMDEFCAFSPSYSISMQKLIEKLREHFNDETKFLSDKSLRPMVKKTIETREGVKIGSRNNAVILFGIEYHPVNADKNNSEYPY